MPLALDVDVAGFGDPAPLMTAQLTVTPATGLLNPSATRTDSGVGSGCPTVPVWRSPPLTLICVAPATLAVIVNVTVGRPVTAAVVDCVPGVGPRDRVVVARPFTSVVEDVGFTEPPLVPGANVTATPATGLLLASRTITDGGMATAVPVVAFWPLPAFIAIWVAAPAVTFTVADVMGVNCWAEKPSVCGPAVPLIDRFVNRAAPLSLVLMSTVPPSVPPPEAIDARTVMPNWLTGLPEASCSWMTGCWRKATPLCTVADGCVVIASFATGPAVAVAVNVTGLPVMPLPAAVAVSVFGPAVVPRVHEVRAAIPPAPVVTGGVGLTLPLPAAGANVTATPATGLLH